jgi:hypothetical protein
MIVHVMVLWVLIPCSDVVGYQRFGGPFCLHLHGEGNPEDYDLKIALLTQTIRMLNGGKTPLILNIGIRW